MDQALMLRKLSGNMNQRAWSDGHGKVNSKSGNPGDRIVGKPSAC
jgi:hypothetical protein